jgi:N-carbamoylputrescine amidase
MRWEGDITKEESLQASVEQMVRKHEGYVDAAAKKGVQILCFQELFFAPYFPAEQNRRWYKYAEPIPGPLTERMSKLARRHKLVLIAPMYEEAMPGVYYNTAIILGADGTLLGRFRKAHIPHLDPGFWEKFYFRPGNLGYPVFDTPYAKIGVYICYDRHFPEGARILGLNGAEIVFNPSATVAGLSEHLWKLEQPAHAVANGYYIAAINRVGDEPWDIGTFYGSSYVANPRGEVIAQASRDRDELLIADIDLDLIREVRNVWQFFRDRRPSTYGPIATE